MPNVLYHALNVGVVDADKLHRVDLERMRLAAEEQTNIMCDVVGKGFLRPGTQHIGNAHNGAYSRLIPFYAGEAQSYALCLTANALKVLDGDVFVSRPAVSTTVQNGDFSSPTGWVLGTQAGTTAQITGGLLRLQALARGTRATAKQRVMLAPGDVGKEHGLRVIVFRGPVQLRVGTYEGAQDVIRETTLRTGYHSLACVGDLDNDLWIEFSSTLAQSVYVNSATFEPAGDLVLPTVWAQDDLQYIRHDQSLDVMYLACEGRKPQRIETRGDNSFSVCDYDSNDGPFTLGTPKGIKLRPDVLEGDGKLYSNLPFFSPDHVGALFRLYHEGQKVDTYLGAEGEFTPTIMVTGINEPDYNERAWTYEVSGTWAGTLRVQRSFDGEDVEFHNFRNAQGASAIDITANVSATNDDNEDNAIAYYRIGFEPGTYSSGAARVRMTYQGGGGHGIARVTSYVSPTEVWIEVLRPFKGSDFTDNWREGSWSENVGWPTAVAFHEGRLWFVGYDSVWGSVSDAYESFDEDLVGDAGPLLRAIAVGGRNVPRWLAPMSNLLTGTDAVVAALRGSSLDEIMTPENFGVRKQDRVGSSRVDLAMLSDDRGLFVEAEGQALMELTYDGTKGRWVATEFSKLTTNLFTTGIADLAVQNRPDQRIWMATGASDAVCVVFVPSQQVTAYVVVSLDTPADQIESVISLPGGNGQDRVIFSARRVVNGVTTRRYERLALDREAIPAPVTKCLDAHVVVGPGATTANLPHLVGRTVWIWKDGQYIEDANKVPIGYVVPANGIVSLQGAAATGACVGLPYRGRYKSAKLEYGDGGNTSMMRNKQLTGIGLLLADYVRSGVMYGDEFDNPAHPLFNLPAEINGVPAPGDIIHGPGKTEPVNPVDAPVTLDARMCIELSKPATILALVMGFEGYGG